MTSLKTDAAFRRLRRGRTGRGRLLLVRWLPTRHGEVRVGIVVSKKVGKAVTRNRVRRRLREIIRRMHLPSADLMIVARPEAAEADHRALAHDLIRALDRSGLLRSQPRKGDAAQGE
ncbi:ribonuclease P protein component [Oceanithermus sp.]